MRLCAFPPAHPAGPGEPARRERLWQGRCGRRDGREDERPFPLHLSMTFSQSIATSIRCTISRCSSIDGSLNFNCCQLPSVNVRLAYAVGPNPPTIVTTLWAVKTIREIFRVKGTATADTDNNPAQTAGFSPRYTAGLPTKAELLVRLNKTSPAASSYLAISRGPIQISVLNVSHSEDRHIARRRRFSVTTGAVVDRP